ESLRPFLRYLLRRHKKQGGVTEIRVAPTKDGAGAKPMSGLFNPDQLDALVELLAPLERTTVPRGQHPRIGEARVFYNPHPVAPGPHARSPGAFARCKPAADGDLVAYSMFAVAVEPVAEEGSPFTDEDRQRARQVARDVARFFTERDVFPIPLDG